MLTSGSRRAAFMRELNVTQDGLGNSLERYLSVHVVTEPHDLKRGTALVCVSAFSEVTRRGWSSFIPEPFESMLSCSSSWSLPNKGRVPGTPKLSQKFRAPGLTQKRNNGISTAFEDVHPARDSRVWMFKGNLFCKLSQIQECQVAGEFLPIN